MIKNLTTSEKRLYGRLDTPIKIQNFLDTLRINFEPSGDTLRSPREVVKNKEAHCIEAALLAAAAFTFHKKPALLMDLKADKSDYDHVLCLYKINGLWGAISKSNHASIRYRDPIFRTLRELALTYFHEYFDNRTGNKSLIAYSRPFNLSKYGDDWITSQKNLWYIGADLDDAQHYPLLSKQTKKILRKADAFERKAGKQTEW